MRARQETGTLGWRRTLSGATASLSRAIAFASALLLVGVPYASAQNPYKIDGVVTDTDNSGVGNGALKTPDPFGNVKELGPINGSNTKIGVIHSAVPPMLGLTNPNSQVDLRAIWTQTVVSGGDQWFYFAWTRDANNGSGFLAIEMQHQALSPACAYDAKTTAELIAGCNPWQNREAGDFLILWDQSGSSTDVYKRVFSGTAPNLVLGAPELLGTAVAKFSSDGFSGEAAVDLTKDVFPAGGGCVNIANTIPATVTGNSDTADYKDTVLALFPPISNCGLLDVKKVTLDPNGNPFAAAGSFPYKVARTGGVDLRYLADFPTGSLTELTGTLVNTVGPPPTTQLDSYDKLIAGNDYTLVETSVPSPWTFKTAECTVGSDTTKYTTGSIPVVVNETTHCIIYNQYPAQDVVYTTQQRVLLYDKISISTFFGTPGATDVVTFKLFSNGSCSGTATHTEAVALAADLTAQTTVGQPVTATSATGDIYSWQVSYPGNTFNKSFSSCIETTALTIKNQ